MPFQVNKKMESFGGNWLKKGRPDAWPSPALCYLHFKR
jgi:hypothetical protein